MRVQPKEAAARSCKTHIAPSQHEYSRKHFRPGSGTGSKIIAFSTHRAPNVSRRQNLSTKLHWQPSPDIYVIAEFLPKIRDNHLTSYLSKRNSLFSKITEMSTDTLNSSQTPTDATIQRSRQLPTKCKFSFNSVANAQTKQLFADTNWLTSRSVGTLLFVAAANETWNKRTQAKSKTIATNR